MKYAILKKKKFEFSEDFPCNASEGLFKCRRSYCVPQSKVCDYSPDCKVTLTDEEPCGMFLN